MLKNTKKIKETLKFLKNFYNHNWDKYYSIINHVENISNLTIKELEEHLKILTINPTSKKYLSDFTISIPDKDGNLWISNNHVIINTSVIPIKKECDLREDLKEKLHSVIIEHVQGEECKFNPVGIDKYSQVYFKHKNEILMCYSDFYLLAKKYELTPLVYDQGDRLSLVLMKDNTIAYSTQILYDSEWETPPSYLSFDTINKVYEYLLPYYNKMKRIKERIRNLEKKRVTPLKKYGVDTRKIKLKFQGSPELVETNNYILTPYMIINKKYFKDVYLSSKLITFDARRRGDEDYYMTSINKLKLVSLNKENIKINSDSIEIDGRKLPLQALNFIDYELKVDEKLLLAFDDSTVVGGMFIN